MLKDEIKEMKRYLNKEYKVYEHLFYCYTNDEYIDLFDKSNECSFYNMWRERFILKTVRKYEKTYTVIEYNYSPLIHDSDIDMLRDKLTRDWVLVVKNQKRLLDFAEEHILDLRMYNFGGVNKVHDEEVLCKHIKRIFKSDDFYIKEEAPAYLPHINKKVRYDFLVRPKPESKIGMTLKSIGLIDLTFAIECKSFAKEHKKGGKYLKKERQLINQCLSYRHSVYLAKEGKKKTPDFILIYTGDLDNPKISRNGIRGNMFENMYCLNPLLDDFIEDVEFVEKQKMVQKINTSRQVYPFIQEQNIFELQILNDEYINILTPRNDWSWPSPERAGSCVKLTKVGATHNYSIDSLCLMSYSLRTKKLKIISDFNNFLGLNAGSSNRKVKSQQIVI